jgi:NAD(P)H dehydrogenase (quinone)
MYHWSAIVATPGYTYPLTPRAGGNPNGTSVTVGQDGKMIEDLQAAN